MAESIPAPNIAIFVCACLRASADLNQLTLEMDVDLNSHSSPKSKNPQKKNIPLTLDGAAGAAAGGEDVLAGGVHVGGGELGGVHVVGLQGLGGVVAVVAAGNHGVEELREGLVALVVTGDQADGLDHGVAGVVDASLDPRVGKIDFWKEIWQFCIFFNGNCYLIQFLNFETKLGFRVWGFRN